MRLGPKLGRQSLWLLAAMLAAPAAHAALVQTYNENIFGTVVINPDDLTPGQTPGTGISFNGSLPQFSLPGTLTNVQIVLHYGWTTTYVVKNQSPLPHSFTLFTTTVPFQVTVPSVGANPLIPAEVAQVTVNSPGLSVPGGTVVNFNMEPYYQTFQDIRPDSATTPWTATDLTVFQGAGTLGFSAISGNTTCIQSGTTWSDWHNVSYPCRIFEDNGQDLSFVSLSSVLAAQLEVDYTYDPPEVPEPATLVLFGSGVLALAGLRVRKQS